MKKLFKSLSLIFVLMSAIFIAGCGDGDDFKVVDEKTTSVQGVGQDGYIVKATVFIDLDEDNNYDPNEPKAETGMDGKFQITATEEQAKFPVVLKGGYDKATWVTLSPADVSKGKTVLSKDGTVLDTAGSEGYAKFRGIFQAPAPDDGDYSSVIVSPITTLIHQHKKNNPGKTNSDAVKEVLAKLGLNDGDVDLLKDDVIAKSKTDDKAMKINKLNVMVANTIKVAADASKTATSNEEDTFISVTQSIASEIVKATSLADVKTEISKSVETVLKDKVDATVLANVKTIAETIVTEVDTAKDEGDYSVYDKIAAVITAVEKNSSNIQEGKEVKIDEEADSVIKDVAENADTSGTETTGEVKGFALKNNQFNGKAVTKSGIFNTSDNPVAADTDVTFSIVNYTGAALSEKANVTITISPADTEQDLRSFELVVPATLTASADSESAVSLSVAANEKVSASGTDVDGNTVTINDLLNEGANTIKSVNGVVTVPLNDWVEMFKAEISNSSSEALQTFTLEGTFKVTLSIDAADLVFGYAVNNNITNKFTAVSGYINFQ